MIRQNQGIMTHGPFKCTLGFFVILLIVEIIVGIEAISNCSPSCSYPQSQSCAWMGDSYCCTTYSTGCYGCTLQSTSCGGLGIAAIFLGSFVLFLGISLAMIYCQFSRRNANQNYQQFGPMDNAFSPNYNPNPNIPNSNDPGNFNKENQQNSYGNNPYSTNQNQSLPNEGYAGYSNQNLPAKNNYAAPQYYRQN